MVNIKDAIKDMGKVEFVNPNILTEEQILQNEINPICMTTPGEIIIYLERLEQLEKEHKRETISPVTLGIMISAFIEGDIKKAMTYVDFIEQKYVEAGDLRGATIIHKRKTGEYKNDPQITLDENIREE